MKAVKVIASSICGDGLLASVSDSLTNTFTPSHDNLGVAAPTIVDSVNVDTTVSRSSYNFAPIL